MSSRPARPLTSASPHIGTVPEEPLTPFPLPLPLPQLLPSDSGAPRMPSQQGQTLPSFPPGGSCLCLRACIPPSFSFASCHFVRLVISWKQLSLAHRDDCEGGPSLSDGRHSFSSPMCQSTHSGAGALARYQNALFSLSCLIPCWQLRSGHGGM